MDEQKTRVLVVEDEVRIARFLQMELEHEGFEAETEGNGTRAYERIIQENFDIVLLDVMLPGMDGITATQALTDALPTCATIIVTTFGRPGYLKRAVAAGAKGFLVKDTPPHLLADAIRRVHSGLRAIDPDLAEQSLFMPDNPLTAREMDICRAALKASSITDIAAQVGLSAGTVRNHLSAIIAKTQARNHHDAVYLAQENGWL